MRKFSFFFFIVVLVVFSVRPVSAQTAKQLPDSTLIVTEEGDTLVQYSSFDKFMTSWEYMAEEFYQHEYGHTVQSKVFGPFYLNVPALQSLLVTSFTNRADAFWTEKQADSFGLYYINSVKGIRRPRITTL